MTTRPCGLCLVHTLVECLREPPEGLPARIREICIDCAEQIEAEDANEAAIEYQNNRCVMNADSVGDWR